MRNVFLKAENQRDFENKGYSTMPMLSSQEVNLVLSELQLMKPGDNFNPESSSEQPSYHLTDLDSNIEYKIKAKQLILSILEPHLKNIFDNYKIIATNFIIKFPGKKKFIIHQDWTFVLDTKNYTSLTLWCPLVDTNEENGTLQVVEGSHKIVPDIATSTVDFYCKNFENAIIEKYGKPVYLNAGECLVFDHSLLHFSDDNHSTQPRYVIQAILVPNEIEPVFYYFDVNEPEKGFEIFQTEPDFFVFQDFFKRPSNLKSLGFIENRNRLLTEEEFIEKMKKSSQIGKGGSRSLVSVKPSGYKRPFFYIHGADGHTIDTVFGRYIDPERPFYGIRAVGRDGQGVPHTCIEEMAAYYIQEIQTVQPEGSYLLGGRCTGGNIALEMAQQLKKRGQKVLLVVMVDSPKPLLTEEEKVEYRKVTARWREEWIDKVFNNSLIEIDLNPEVFEYNLQIPANHVPQIYSGRVVYFAAQEKSKNSFISKLLQPDAWNHWVIKEVEVYEVPGDHLSMTKESNVCVLAEKLSTCLERAECEDKKIESDGEQLSSKLSINQELEEKGYKVIDFIRADEVQSLLRLYEENSIPKDLLDPVVSATLCSSDLSYRQQATQEIKKIFIPKLEVLFPNHRAVVCTFINKRIDKFYSSIELHQDRSFADETNLKTFGIWCPLVDVNEQNGCFYVVQKSHLLNSTPRSSNGFPYSQEILSLMKQDYLTSVPMKAGQALVYDNRLIHGSFPNSTDTERLAVICVLTPKDNPVLFYYRDSQTSNKLEVFEVDDAFYDSYIQEQKPENAKSLGIFDYQVVPITPEQLVEFMSEPQPKVDKNTGITEKFLSFFNLLRGSDWWFYKIPPLLAIAYAEILLQATPPQQSIATLLTLLASMFFVAAYGHVINDIFDVEIDLLAGKQNRMASLSNPQRLLLCITLAGLGLVPWLLIGLGTQSAILLAAIYILLTIYSAPPLRLKERDIWGAITDAAQVHAVPTLLVATVFSHLADTPQPESAILATAATAWAFLAGIRGILLHQIWDRESDLSAGVTTLITRIGVESAKFLITYISFPLELLLLTLLILIISQFAPSLLIFCALYILLRIISTQSAVTVLDPAPAQKTYILPHDFYEVWLPLALLILLAIREPVFLSLLVIHIGLFYPAIAQRAIEFNSFLLLGLEKTANLVKLLQNEFGKTAENIQQSQAELQRLQVQLKQTHEQLAESHSQLYTSETELSQLRCDFQQNQNQLQHFYIQLQQTNKKLTQSQSKMNTFQTELAQLKSYLQQTQGVEGIMSYYRSCIATNLDDIQLYHQALEVKPDDAQIYLQLGNALVRQNRFDDAMASYQTALQLHPDNFEIHLELAKTLEKEQKWDEAIASYRRAIELNPDYSWSHKHLGDILAKRGQLTEASLSYRRALQLQPRIF